MEHHSMWIYRFVLTLLVSTGLDQVWAQEPQFKPPSNVTVVRGEDAALSCTVHNLANHSVAWIDDKSHLILTINTHVLTHNPRIRVQEDGVRWLLHIHNVQEQDSGAYCCQIDTFPVKSQVVYLQVLEPPSILDRESRPTSLVQEAEGDNFSLSYNASGNEESKVIRRLDGNTSVSTISRNSSHQQDDDLRWTDSGEPRVTIHFFPGISISNPQVGAMPGSDAELECSVDLFAHGLFSVSTENLNYFWSTENGTIRNGTGKYETVLMGSHFDTVMRLVIRNVTCSDYGIYKCIVQEPESTSRGSVTLDELSRDDGRKVCSGAGYAASRIGSLFWWTSAFFGEPQGALASVSCLVMYLTSRVFL